MFAGIKLFWLNVAITLKTNLFLRLTASVSCVLPREQTNETGNVFRAENVLKRNVATRQPARDVGQVLERRFYALSPNSWSKALIPSAKCIHKISRKSCRDTASRRSVGIFASELSGKISRSRNGRFG